jgi:hypothetical protein
MLALALRGTRKSVTPSGFVVQARAAKDFDRGELQDKERKGRKRVIYPITTLSGEVSASLGLDRRHIPKHGIVFACYFFHCTV